MRFRQSSDIATLAKLHAALAPYDGTVELRLPGVGDETPRADGAARRCRVARSARARQDSHLPPPHSPRQSCRADRSGRRIASAVSRMRANFDQTVNIEALATLVNMSRHFVSPEIQSGYRHEPTAIPENAPPAGSATADARDDARRGQCRLMRRLRKRVAVQPRIQPFLWHRAGEEHLSPNGRHDAEVRASARSVLNRLAVRSNGAFRAAARPYARSPGPVIADAENSTRTPSSPTPRVPGRWSAES
jgi:hypothetical protein